MDFADLKRSREEQLAHINKTIQSLTPQSQASDEEKDIYWKPTVDEAGNGSAIIRFLSAPPGEDVPFVRYWNHAFKGPGGWYIENSLTTIGQQDPVSEYNKELWDTGTEANQKKVREQKRKLHYVANILVVKDPGNPSNEGKVFKFKFGKKIFDKIQDMMTPDELDDDAKPINPFDFWEGANFRLKIRLVEGYRNYDKSEFDKPSAVAKSDADIEKIWRASHSLQAEIAPEKFKSYDELKTRLYKVLGLSGASKLPASSTPPWDDETPATPAPSAGRSKPALAPAASDDGDDDFFSRLAED